MLISVKRLVFRAQFRSRLSEKLMELGNLVLVGLTLGQFVASKSFSTEQFVTGIILAIACYITSYIVGS